MHHSTHETASGCAISPRMRSSIRSSVDVASAVAHLSDVSVLLVDTDKGWGGADPQWSWSGRRQFRRALEEGRLGGRSRRLFMRGSDHYLRGGDTAESAVLAVLSFAWAGLREE